MKGSSVVSRPISMPPKPARPAPTATVTTATRSGSMPRRRARSRLSATARIERPVRVQRRKAQIAAMMHSAMAKFFICCGPMR